MLNQTKPDPVRSPLLDKAQAQGIRHGYFTRTGGVSTGIYQGLNIGTGSDDDKALVAENRARVAAWMGVPASHLLTAWQIHSPDVVVVSEPFAGERPKADAIVTDRPGIAIGASTADCGPVLFADAGARIIGAAHAGWKGAFTGVLENTIAAMESLGARRENIVAVLGPSIGPDNYEVGPEFVARFVEADAENIALLRALRHIRPCHVRSQPLHGRPACQGRRDRRGPRPLHLCRGRSVLLLPAHHAPQGSPITAGRFRPSFWRMNNGAAF